MTTRKQEYAVSGPLKWEASEREKDKDDDDDDDEQKKKKYQ